MRDKLDAETIAKGLTEAQRDAVLGKFSWDSPQDQDAGEAELYKLGIWNPAPRYGQKSITHFGIAVRSAILRDQ